MNDTGNPEQLVSPSINYWVAIKGIIALSLASFIGVSALNPTTNECGQTEDWRYAALISGCLGIYGCWQIWQCIAHKATWTKENLTIRSRWGKKKTVKFSDLSNVEYFSDVSIYTFDDEKLVVFNWVRGAKLLSKKINLATKAYAPYLAYTPAFRGALDQAENAGCLRCGSLCSLKEIVAWKDDPDESDMDLGECPSCSFSEGLMFGVHGTVVSEIGLTKWNEILLADLDPDEKEDRLEELRNGLIAAGEKKILAKA